ncbi:hypothetical protein AMTR_s00033p00222690 [Amborella trichopoda]|uniref:Uncharacterized protein n=1 Tax=Amborella trichopoda TaxID=13333 RepID=U5CYZ2_AMBTC|nr:hypothetical protein AMTR_s00033p00222690 [Amborella trichopoda]
MAAQDSEKRIDVPANEALLWSDHHCSFSFFSRTAALPGFSPPSKQLFPKVHDGVGSDHWSWFFIFSALVEVGYQRGSKLLVHYVLAMMYPLRHRRAALRTRVSSHPSFDALNVDRLSFVVIDDIEDNQLVVGDGVDHPNLDVQTLMELDSSDDLAMVGVEDTPPLSVIPAPVRLLLQFSTSRTETMTVQEEPELSAPVEVAATTLA